MNKRVLMIVTSNAELGDTGKATGIWAEELAVPYYAFIDAGLAVELASPKGGAVPFDPASIKPKGQNETHVERFLADVEAQRRCSATCATAQVDAASFDAVFFPGGHGTMWDLPTDQGVTLTVEAAYRANKIIAAVCHGPAGLVAAKRPDGKSILQGKRINAFTNAEESAAGLTQVVPFALETRMRDLGGIFVNADNWHAFAVRDGNLITGQNPMSSALVAQHVLDALGVVKTKTAA